MEIRRVNSNVSCQSCDTWHVSWSLTTQRGMPASGVKKPGTTNRSVNIFLPESPAGYVLRVRLDDVPVTGKLSAIQSPTKWQNEAKLSAGTHKIEVVYDRAVEESTLKILIDDAVVIEESRPADWEPRSGSRGGFLLTGSRQSDVDEPFILFDRVFDQANAPKPKPIVQPGILIWIEPSP